MPRRQFDPQSRTTSPNKTLAEKLAAELESDREYGQPFIYEQKYQTGKLRVSVIWDDWRRLSLPERSATILKAYELAEGPETRDRIALASGLTVPEAHEAGLLPYEVIAAVRKGDPIQRHEVPNALRREGASLLFHPTWPRLFFATEEEAEAARKRLSERYPGTDEVWIINREITPQDYATASESADAAASDQ